MKKCLDVRDPESQIFKCSLQTLKQTNLKSEAVLGESIKSSFDLGSQ
jgi:hypothetical protein